MANLSNTTSPHSDTDTIDYACTQTPAFRHLELVASVVLLVMATFGNSLILASLIKFKNQFRGSMFIFIGNMAAADLMVGLSMLFFIAEDIAPDLVEFWSFCVAKIVVFLLPFVASMLFMLCISVDRYMAVVFPFKHRLQSVKQKMNIAFSISVWAMSIVLSTVFFSTPRDDFQEDAVVCRIGAIIPLTYSLISTSVSFLFFLINIVLYALVIHKLRSLTKPGDSVQNRNNAIKTRLMVIVFSLFTVCYFPFLICALLILTTPSVRQDMICVKEYVAMTARFNATLNWIVYGLDNNKFKTAFMTLLSCKHGVCRKKYDNGSSVSNTRSRRIESINNNTR